MSWSLPFSWGGSLAATGCSVCLLATPVPAAARSFWIGFACSSLWAAGSATVWAVRASCPRCPNLMALTVLPAPLEGSRLCGCLFSKEEFSSHIFKNYHFREQLRKAWGPAFKGYIHLSGDFHLLLTHVRHSPVSYFSQEDETLKLQWGWLFT